MILEVYLLAVWTVAVSERPFHANLSGLFLRLRCTIASLSDLSRESSGFSSSRLALAILVFHQAL